MTSTKRNYALDFWKFIFAIIVVLFHSANLTSNAEERIFINGRIAVEFFFIVSGCMMAASLERNNEPSVALDTVRFIKRKYFSLMPNAIVGSLLCFIVIHASQQNNSIKVLIKHFIQFLPELFLIKSCGLNIINFNGPTWYLASMLIVMFIVYPIYKSNKELFASVIAPITFLLLMGYLYRTYGSLSNLESWVTYTTLANIRALADILGGIVCHQIIKFLSKFRYKLLMRVVFTAIAWFCYLIIIIYIYGHGSGKADFAIFVLFMIAVVITISQCGIEPILFRSKVFAWLGKYSYSLYVGHSCWRKAVVSKAFYPAHWEFHHRVLAYLILSLLSGLFVMYISILLRKIWYKVKEPLKTMVLEKAE